MTVKKWSLALVAFMLVAPLSASALGISIVGVSSTGASNTVLQFNEVITFDLVLENDTNEEVFGLGIGAYGYDTGAPGNSDDNRLAFVGGTNAPGVFGTLFLPGTPNTSPFALMGNSPVSEQGQPFPISLPRRVQLFNAVDTVGHTGDGTNDVGIAGLQTVPGGDVHIQVSFQAQNLGLTTIGDVTLEFGTGQFGNQAITTGGGELTFYNDSYTLTVIPEPGTALLMGLGLAGLAVNRRR